MKLLIITEVKYNQISLNKIFSKTLDHHELFYCSDMKEVFQTLRNNKIDLIIFDILFQKFNGRDMHKIIKLENVPIVYYSSKEVIEETSHQD